MGIFDLLATLLATFYSLVPSYALSIALLTLLVMVVVTPLTIRGTKSMIKMQRLQPELKKIQTRFKDDRERMNQELMAFYKANNINPVGGCLPLVVQAPIFLVLYRVVRGLTTRVSDAGVQLGTTTSQLRGGSSTLQAIADTKQKFDPKYISHSSELFKDLAGATQMKSFGLDLAESASAALRQSIGHALPYLFMIALVAVTSYVQQRQIYARTSKTGQSSQMNPQQQMIMKVMPFMLPVFSFGLPAALVVYFLVSNLWRIGQQAYITRTLYHGGTEIPVVIPPSAEEPPARAKTGPAGSRSAVRSNTGRASTGRASSPSTSAMGRNRRGSGTPPTKNKTER